LRLKKRRGVERRGELHRAAHSGELGRNSDKRFTRRRGLPRPTGASTGYTRKRRSLGQDRAARSELAWPEQQTPASACSATGRRRCASSAFAAGVLREWRRSEWRGWVRQGAGEEERGRGATGRHGAADDGVRATRGGQTLPRAPRRRTRVHGREEADAGTG
jgi:hypothetical protein